MRIALVSREYPPFFGGGIGTYARHMAPALAAHGHDVHVITQSYDESHPRIETRGRLTIHRVPAPGDPAGWTSRIMRFAALAGRVVCDLARRDRIDVAEFAECEGAGVFTCVLNASGVAPSDDALCAPPTVIHLHTPTEMLFRLGSIHQKTLTAGLGAYFLAERAAIHHADHICAPSRFIAEWVTRHYALDRTPTVIPYAIPGLPGVPADVDRQKRALFVGRIEPRKGVEVLLRAWERIAVEHPDWTLRIIGRDTSTSADGRSLRASLEAGLSDHARASVDFRDALPPELLAREYAAASLCVIPSLWENFPNVCIESMSFARPVVVSDEGGMKEMIGDTDAGLAFRSGDPDSLADALRTMLTESPSVLKRRGAAGRARIAAICDEGRVVRERIAMYERTIQSAARRQPDANRTARRRLAFWRNAQQAAALDLTQLGLPELPQRMTQWLQLEEAAA